MSQETQDQIQDLENRLTDLFDETIKLQSDMDDRITALEQKVPQLVSAGEELQGEVANLIIEVRSM